MPSLTVVGFLQSGKKHSARFSNGTTLFVGSEVPFQSGIGLFQKNLSAIKHIGVYAPTAYVPRHGNFAHFIWPTIKAESSGYFGRLNSYDRAAFTFGATQLAAHTPETNLILLFRRLLALPSAPDYFPELSLVGGKVTLATPAGAKLNLEQVVPVTLASGKKEKQLRKFMDYLNPDSSKIDNAEVSAAARLMLWTKNEPAARDAQVEILVERVKQLIGHAKAKVPLFDGKDWHIALWIVDILYQGRGTFTAINAAMKSPSPLTKLSQIGCATYKGRCATIKAEIAALDTSGVLNGFTV